MDGRDDGFLVGDSQVAGFPYTLGTRGVPDKAFFRHTNTNAHKLLFIYIFWEKRLSFLILNFLENHSQ